MMNSYEGIVRATGSALLAVGVAVSAGCDKAQLLAPTRSMIVLSAPATFLPPGGTAAITAFVVEEAGTPVHNGTTVRFTTTLGRVDPVEVQTRNGLAITTYFAPNGSGIAQIRASSGSATGGDVNANLVEIVVGAAAVNVVTLRANPGSVGSAGGTVELVATVVGEAGQAIPGISVTFSTDQGTLGASNAVTDAQGEARTTLTTTQQSLVTATAGTTTSNPVTVGLRAGPIVTIACAPATGVGSCAAVQSGITTNTATVVFTITRPAGSSTLRSAVIDFGDGTSQNLGNLAGGTATITHTYSGPSGPTAVVYTATVLASDVNGETASTSTTVTVSRPELTPINVTITAVADPSAGQRWTFTAVTTGGGEGIASAFFESFTWDFGDGESTTTSGNTTAHVYQTGGSAQRYTVTVTVRTPDGRTATGRTEIVVSGP